MKHSDILKLVPDQIHGEKIEVNSSCNCENLQDATQLFASARAKLLDVNNWHKVAGVISAEFKLLSADKTLIDGDAQNGK